MWVDWIESKCSPCDVLELACGSGEITEMLVQDGFDVSALDLSDEMIEQAKQKDTDNKIQFYCQDVKDLSNFSKFSAIFCLCDSFNYLLGKEEVSKFFKEVSDHLADLGYFFFDTHSLDPAWKSLKMSLMKTGSF